uniref:Reverse transcriptase domain-containing protein n=1 Tax=Tanacetum cinerariifolium TaxID=118510 RepID=A0A6L2JPY9_TANCI|nr:reverse transcriptase domain-containing protein [Tanacetum cinerariifolium]
MPAQLPTPAHQFGYQVMGPAQQVQSGLTGSTVTSGQATILPHAFTVGTLHDPASGAWNMDSRGSSHLNNSLNSLSENFNTCMYPSISDFMTRRVLLSCDSTGDLYPVTAPSPIPHAFLVNQHTWHQRLGHPRSDVLRRLVSSNFISCNKEKLPVFFHACQLGKHVRLPFVSSSTMISFFFDIIHSDVWTSPISSLSEFVLFRNYVRTQFKCEIKSFQCDHGGEFDNRRLYTLFAVLKHLNIMGSLKDGSQETDIDYLLLYVDDIVLTASSEILLQRIIRSLHQEFAMTDLEILDMAHMVNCNPSRTSIDIESTMGMMVCLYMHDPREPHFLPLKRILRYVREAEYHGVANVVAETCWLRNLLHLREYCDKNCHQILPIIVEKLHQEKAQQEKLKAVKARLNFEEALQYSESETLNRRRNLKERLGPRYARTRSGSPEPRRGRFKSLRKKGPERRTVFKRLEKGVFHRLGDKEKNVFAHSRGSERKYTESCYQSSCSKDTETASEKHRHKREYSRRTKAVSESKGSAGGHWKSKPKKQKSSMEDDLSQPWVWFDDLPKESIDSYDDLRKAFLENYLQQKKCIKDPVEIHNIKQRNRESIEEFVPRIARQRITQTFSPESVISFPTLGEEDGTKGPMIIEAEMGGNCVHCIYVDGGSSSEILYEHCYSKFRQEIKNQLIFMNTPLAGFSGEIIWPLGQISLLVKIGNEEHSTTAWMNFMVVTSPSPYNGIIERLRSSRIIPLEFSIVSKPRVSWSAINQIREEKIQVAIHLEYPEQTVAIGSTLTEEGRKELCGLLRRHLDVQKKRGQVPERNKAISEEVKKLVETGIMKEVHYHSWLSNPVMVKKHDDSWRICVDFKDLNKAYPKNGYPLPEIDWKVESLWGYPYKCFLDVYKGYHQIKMAKEDEEKTTFITSQGIFCYSKIPFGLKTLEQPTSV